MGPHTPRQDFKCISSSLVEGRGQTGYLSVPLSVSHEPSPESGTRDGSKDPMETVVSTSSTSIMHQARLGVLHLVMQQGWKVLTSCSSTPLQERAAFPTENAAVR